MFRPGSLKIERVLYLTPSDARFHLGILTLFLSESLSLTVDRICGFFRPQIFILFNDIISPFRQGLFVILRSIGSQHIGNLVCDMVWVLS